MNMCVCEAIGDSTFTMCVCEAIGDSTFTMGVCEAIGDSTFTECLILTHTDTIYMLCCCFICRNQRASLGHNISDMVLKCTFNGRQCDSK